MATKAKGTGKRGSRKIGNNKTKCQKYFLQNRREKNKKRRMAKYLRRLARRKRIRELRNK